MKKAVILLSGGLDSLVALGFPLYKMKSMPRKKYVNIIMWSIKL